MHAAEVVLHEVQRHGCGILDLLSECIRQPREPACTAGCGCARSRTKVEDLVLSILPRRAAASAAALPPLVSTASSRTPGRHDEGDWHERTTSDRKQRTR